MGERSRKILKIFTIEIIGFLIFAVVVLFILFFFNVIPNNYFRPKPQATNSEVSTKKEKVNPLITSSDHPDFNLYIGNPDIFLKSIESWQLFGKPYTIQSGSTDNLENVKVVLTDKKVGGRIVKENNKEIFEMHARFEGNTLTFYVYVDKDRVNESKVYMENILTNQVLIYLFSLSHASSSQSQQVIMQNLNDISQRLRYDNAQFTISEK